jgi:hypothetical protein
MMSEWGTEKKKRFRGDVLNVLAARHLTQRSRMDDVQICLALQSLSWQCEMNDVVTILQDMQGRGWVKFKDRRSQVTRRVELFEVEICPEGQDLVDDTTRHPAVSFL